jgi:hypothetical protein
MRMAAHANFHQASIVSRESENRNPKCEPLRAPLRSLRLLFDRKPQRTQRDAEFFSDFGFRISDLSLFMLNNQFQLDQLLQKPIQVRADLIG